ncbi:MAG TPA: hypothetical protein VFP65_10290 [Anaeromyxobacteraceae bacterium]|nr:hypothetical protein [Anaeromyxobacteraceae bacterium]
MSTDAHAHPEHEEHGGHHGIAHPPAELDLIPSGRIVWVGVVAMIVFVAGSLAAAWQMQVTRRVSNPEGPVAFPASAGQAKIGIVEQRLFEHANQGVAWREQARRHLDSYGWVDQSKGVVHIPIDKAMDLVEKGERP